jgi:cytosine/adenosine deaminase-related metal-dependent hydrolase
VEGAGIEENVRFIRKARQSGNDQIAALFGLHASMTLGDQTLRRCAELGRELGAGFHVHVDEAECDSEESLARFRAKPMDRFLAVGITGPNSIFAHGIHLDERGRDILRDTGSMLVTNPESNMNNGLAMTPLLELVRRGALVGLGTDGMSSRMPAQARAFVEAAHLLLRGNRAICERLFKTPRGRLAAGQQADVILLDYQPFTPFQPSTLLGHLLFGLVAAPVSTTICRGRILLENGQLQLPIDEQALCANARERAKKLWARIR